MANFTHQSEQNENKLTSSSNLSDLFKRKNQAQQNSHKQLSSSENLASKKKQRSLRNILSSIALFLLVIGGVSAMVLTQISQDVRQQASGCTYWNGEAAVEGAVDNRGGIRQECKNGLWDTPDDGNTDPSQIIAQQQAEKDKLPKRGCVNWKGETVSHGSHDNRGGIRQQCKDGLWDTPDDGNTDPSEIIEKNKEVDSRSCILWDSGATVGAGTCDDRRGLLQVCKNGLWSPPQGNDCKSPFSSIEDETHQVVCELGDNEVYATSELVCQSAGKLIDKTNELAEEIAGVFGGPRDILSTFTSTKTTTHNIECNLNGTVTFVAEESVCTDSNGVLAGDDTPIFSENRSDVNPFLCIVNGKRLYANTEKTCITNGGVSSNAAKCADGTIVNSCNDKGEKCIDGKLLADKLCIAETKCTPNSCILNYSDGENKWCGSDGKPNLSLSCSLGQSCRQIPEYSCNSSGQKCIGGRLFSNQDCQANDTFVTSAECERDNAVAIQNVEGECKLLEGGYEFVEVDTNMTFETVRWIPKDECVTENRSNINDGLGECRVNLSGWVYVADELNYDVPLAEDVEQVECTAPFSSWSFWNWNWQGCDKTPTEPLVESEQASYTCHENSIDGNCYEYTSEWPCSENPYTDTLINGSCGSFQVNQSVVCHRILNGSCEQQTFSDDCGAGYSPGFCTEESSTELDTDLPVTQSRTVTCYYDFGPGGCLDAPEDLEPFETCSNRSLGDIIGQDSNPCE